VNTLVINSGSSSIKMALFDSQSFQRLHDVRINGIGEAMGNLCTDGRTVGINVQTHADALQILLDTLESSGRDLSSIIAVGHRVLHGGESLVDATVITETIEMQIDAMSDLAPLHNPACLAGIRAARIALAHCPHVAVFDTAFHATLPARAKLYALSNEITTAHNIRRFGFHGISHEYVSHAAAAALGVNLRNLRIISCHLGNGCSIAAVENGRSVETSMGMTPLEGLVMGSRCGDIDPGILVKLLRDPEMDADGLDSVLNRRSGLLGMTGTNNMRDIEQRAAEGDEACRRAIHVFTHRVRKYVGAYAAVMGGTDAIVFTGGIGEHSAFVRHRIAQRFDYLGASLDEDRNRDAAPKDGDRVIDISAASSRVKILIVATDEEAAIAKSVGKVVRADPMIEKEPRIPIAVSARHVHLTEESIEELFGADYTLTPKHPLSQPGQFASNETVSLVGPRNRIDGVCILGPARNKNQVEISRSDEFFLGIDAPVRASGDTANTPGIRLEGTVGSLTLENGVICALRHIHMHQDDAKRLCVRDGDLVNVAVDSNGRDLTFGDVLIRVSETFRLEMHIDTDEANAAGLKPRDVGTLSPLHDHAKVVDISKNPNINSKMS